MVLSLRESLPQYITTDRLTLELWNGSAEHYELVLQVLNETAQAAANGINTPEKYDRFTASFRVSPTVFKKSYNVDTDVIYLIREARDGPLVGVISLAQRKHSLPADVGWSVKQKFWGNGYAPEAAKAVIKVLRDDFGVEEMISISRCGNLPSIRTAQKVGLLLGGEVQDDKGASRVVYLFPGTRIDFSIPFSMWGDNQDNESK